MPITGATLAEAAHDFRNHINHVLSRTVTRMPTIQFEVGPRFQITFRQDGGPIKAPLHTRFGPMELYFGQVCDSIVRGARHELRTLRYTYELYPGGAENSIIRWEYVRDRETEDALWCRHHLQGPIPFEINQHEVSMNDLHLPTGYVTFEEVLRFCIVDLEVQPLSDDWDGVLTESYASFKLDFTR